MARRKKIKIEVKPKPMEIRLKPLKFEMKIPKMRRSSRRKRR